MGRLGGQGHAGAGLSGCCCQFQAGPDGVRDERGRQAVGQFVHGSPSGAVRGYDEVGCECREGVDGGGDDWLEEWAGEVEAADDGMDLLDSGQGAGVAKDVDHAGMSAAGDHQQSAAVDVHDQRLIVEDQRVGFPPSVA